MFRRYVFDPAKTPYFVSVAKLDKIQAQNELFVFSLLTSVLFGVLGIASISPSLPHGTSPWVTFGAFGLAGASAGVGLTKHPLAAATAAVAPVACLAYALKYGLHPGLGTVDYALLLAILLLWQRYCWRIFCIVAAYPNLAVRSGVDDENSRK
jgi:hypothetical protein